MTAWKKVQGSQAVKPSEFDTTSSAVTVYQRKNVERITIENEDNSVTEFWQYDERQMTREEYTILLLEQNRADIDFIAMETGVGI